MLAMPRIDGSTAVGRFFMCANLTSPYPANNAFSRSQSLAVRGTSVLSKGFLIRHVARFVNPRSEHSRRIQNSNNLNTHIQRISGWMAALRASARRSRNDQNLVSEPISNHRCLEFKIGVKSFHPGVNLKQSDSGGAL